MSIDESNCTSSDNRQACDRTADQPTLMGQLLIPLVLYGRLYVVWYVHTRNSCPIIDVYLGSPPRTKRYDMLKLLLFVAVFFSPFPFRFLP